MAGDKMIKAISIGKQNYESLIKNNNFFVDKTYFIKEWWEAQDDVTLITRPRRFGKTLNMSMLNCFFSNKYKDRSDLFEGLSIWEDEKYRKIQGTYPVIFLSFADVKQGNYLDAVQKIKNIFVEMYSEFSYLGNWHGLTENEKKQFASISTGMSNVTAQDAVKNLSNYLSRYYGKNTIILLDEYDTPMQEAYVGGYWDEFTLFIRSLFNATFKTNPYLERAVMTGVTRVSKESIFSDLNNLKVVTSTSDSYATCFGFTEEEVFVALDERELSQEKEKIREWYDGFTFGNCKNVYNPWSITNYLDEKKYKPYWADTSSNGLISRILQKANTEIKQEMEQLLRGDTLEKILDEQIIFNQLDENEDAIWSLMLASGYLCVDSYHLDERTLQRICNLKLTNFETTLMFEKMVRGWFCSSSSNYNSFVKALLKGDLEEMNHYMNKVALSTFSYFDVGGNSSEVEPERFYHGFVLGLLVEFREKYEICSNGESGLGRYDVMLIPRRENDATTPAIILEFKVHNPKKEKNMEETVANALMQIKEKKYDTRLLEMGIKQESIRHYGFAFKGKEVLIG